MKHSQNSQRNKFVNLGNIAKKLEMGFIFCMHQMEFIFCIYQKSNMEFIFCIYETSNIVFDGNGYTCPKYLK